MFEVLATVLAFFYQVTKSYGFAIILLTVAVRLVLFPLTAKQMRSMQGMSRIQPELKRLQAEHKDDRMKLQEEMTALYRREGINPVGGCLPLVLQIPVFIGLFNVIRGLSSSGRLASLQVDVPKPQYLSPNSPMYRSIVNGGGRLLSFGFDLAQSASGVTGGIGTRFPYVFLIVVYVVSAYVQQHLANKRNPAAAGQAAQVQQLMKIFPLFLGIFYYSMPAGLVLYFVASNLWTIAQQEVLARAMPTPKTDQTPVAVIDVPATVSGTSPGKSSTRGKKPNAVATDVTPSPEAKSAAKTPAKPKPKPSPAALAQKSPVSSKAALPSREGTATPRPGRVSDKTDGTTAKAKRKAR